MYLNSIKFGEDPHDSDESRQINPLMTKVIHHIETSQLICRTNLLTGFYVIGNIGR